MRFSSYAGLVHVYRYSICGHIWWMNDKKVSDGGAGAGVNDDS